METLDAAKFLDSLPPSLTGDSQVQALAQALDSELQGLPALASSISILPFIAQQPEAILDVLAIHLAVLGYQQTFSIEIKRALVSQSIITHRKRGTAGAMRLVIDAIFDAGLFTLQEGAAYLGGAPYHFAVIANGTTFATSDLQSQLAAAIAVAKNARSIFDGIILTQPVTTTLYVGCAYATFKYSRIREI